MRFVKIEIKLPYFYNLNKINNLHWREKNIDVRTEFVFGPNGVLFYGGFNYYCTTALLTYKKIICKVCIISL